MAGSRKSCDRAESKTVGCLSAIFRLLHGRIYGRRRLTQAERTEQSCTDPEKFKEMTTDANSMLNANQNQKNVSKLTATSHVDSNKNITFDGSQSMKMAIYHMKQQALEVEAPEVPRGEPSQRPSVVARLMGLEDLPTTRLAHRTEKPSELRNIILDALQKCDEEVRTLRRIIEVIQSGERYNYRLTGPPGLLATHTNSRSLGGTRSRKREKYSSMNLKINPKLHRQKKCMQFNYKQPSPMAVLDDHFFFHCQERIPTQGHRLKYDAEQFPGIQNLIRDAHAKLFGGATTNGASINPTSTRDVGADLERVKMIHIKCSDRKENLILELERIAFSLEREIFGSLLEETISELGFACRPSLAFFRCRRRLFT